VEGHLALEALGGGSFPTLVFGRGSTLRADASLFAGASFDDNGYPTTGVFSPTLSGEVEVVAAALMFGGAATCAAAEGSCAPCPDFRPLPAGASCHQPPIVDNTFLPCVGGLTKLVAGPGARLSLDGCVGLPHNLTVVARRSGALAFANLALPLRVLSAAYNSLVNEDPGQSLSLAAVTIPELPGAVSDSGTLSVGADGGWAREPAGFRPLGDAVDPLCAEPATALDEPWRDPTHYCDPNTAGTCHTDTAAIDDMCLDEFGGLPTSVTNPSGFAAPGGPPRVYVLGEGGAASLPLAPPGAMSCGTSYPAWLSAWPGPHATTSGVDLAVPYGAADGGPPIDYTEGLAVGRLPAAGDPALVASACFDGGGEYDYNGRRKFASGQECSYHAALALAMCGDGRLAWRLPPAPACDAGYCAAAPPAGTGGGGR
jgi:hypothetical protein